MTGQTGATLYLLDTNVVSEMGNLAPNSQVSAFLARLKEGEAFISSMTLAELERGIWHVKPRRPRFASELRAWLEGRVMALYGDHILPFDAHVVRAWGQLMSTEAARRQPPPLQDSLIAATAYAHRLTLVTRNTADFEAFPVAVLNPWEFHA